MCVKCRLTDVSVDDRLLLVCLGDDVSEGVDDRGMTVLGGQEEQQLKLTAW